MPQKLYKGLKMHNYLHIYIGLWFLFLMYRNIWPYKAYITHSNFSYPPIQSQNLTSHLKKKEKEQKMANFLLNNIMCAENIWKCLTSTNKQYFASTITNNMFFSLWHSVCELSNRKKNRIAVSGLDEMLKRQENLHIIVCVAEKSPPEQ